MKIVSIKIVGNIKNSIILFGIVIFFLALQREALAQVSQMPQACAAGAIVFDSKKISPQGNLGYVSSFDAINWNGHLRAVKVNSQGEIGGDQWDAAEKIPVFDRRNIITWNRDTGSGNEFLSGNLTPQQKMDLADDQSGSVLQYLRGDASKERKNGGMYRNRASPLGDIVNSIPLYVKNTDFGYRKIAARDEATAYKTFVQNKKLRAPYIYVGANDGMLHQFDAITGVEKFAYVPASVYPNLKSLSDPNYMHHYFVDGQITEGDAYLNGAWKNYLLGATGAGAKSIFAMDITEPDSLGSGSIKWELSAEGDFIDLGYVVGRAYVARSRSGDWIAVFGNGYDSKNKKAILYIVNLFTGALIKKIEGVGDLTKPNGLSAPAFLFNAKRELITAYAGDLQGNLWKFDLNDTDREKWKVDFGGKPLFVANNTIETQPITTEPLVDYAPHGGYMVMFGTGKHYEDGDRRSNRVESLYGIWDQAGTSSAPITTTRASILVEQKLVNLANGNRSLSANSIDWKTKRGWYIDFNLASGEHVTGEPVLVGDVLNVTTYAPSTQGMCGSGVSQLLAVSYKTGGAYDSALFGDANVSSITIPATVASPVFIANTKRPSLGTPIKIKPGIVNQAENREIIPEIDEKTASARTYEIAINKRDGSGMQIFNIQPSGGSVFRTWRQIFVNY